MAVRSQSRGLGPFYQAPSDGNAGTSVFVWPLGTFPGGGTTIVTLPPLKSKCNVLRLTAIPSASSVDTTSTLRVFHGGATLIAGLVGPWDINVPRTSGDLGSVIYPEAFGLQAGFVLTVIADQIGADLPPMAVILEISAV